MSFVLALSFAVGVGCVGRVGRVGFGVVFGGCGFFEGEAHALHTAIGAFLSAFFGALAFSFLECAFGGRATFGGRVAFGLGLFAFGFGPCAAGGGTVALEGAAGDEELGLILCASCVLGSAFGGFFVAQSAITREHFFADAGVVFAEEACIFGRVAVGCGGDIDDLAAQFAGWFGLFFAILGSDGTEGDTSELFSRAVEALDLDGAGLGGGWRWSCSKEQESEQDRCKQVDRDRDTRKDHGTKILHLVGGGLGVLAWVNDGHE